MLENDSVIEITSELESSAYVDMTLSCLKKYGIEIVNENNEHRRYIVKGGQKYKAMDSNVEGDWSQAAFWTVGGSLGEAVTCSGVDYTSLQGDKAVVLKTDRNSMKSHIILFLFQPFIFVIFKFITVWT